MQLFALVRPVLHLAQIFEFFEFKDLKIFEFFYNGYALMYSNILIHGTSLCWLSFMQVMKPGLVFGASFAEKRLSINDAIFLISCKIAEV